MLQLLLFHNSKHYLDILFDLQRSVLFEQTANISNATLREMPRAGPIHLLEKPDAGCPHVEISRPRGPLVLQRSRRNFAKQQPRYIGQQVQAHRPEIVELVAGGYEQIQLFFFQVVFPGVREDLQNVQAFAEGVFANVVTIGGPPRWPEAFPEAFQRAAIGGTKSV